MNARLYLLRHAKSDWGDPACPDFDRPLNQRGRKGAQCIGDFLRQQQLVPEQILCSPACRARETLAGVLAELPQLPRVHFDKALYLASPATILGCIHQAEATPASLMVIAHNPGMQQLARQLVESGELRLCAELGNKYPTAGLAILKANLSSWQETAAAKWELEHFVTPRKLGQISQG